jgi:crotonobetainyl-CoA:carnitine CoA-transferase CaiB-like acyl-CoA transferase
MWKRLCTVLGLQHLPDDPRYASNAARIERRQELKDIIEAKLREGTRKQWSDKLLAADIPAGPINTLADVFADEQVQHLRLAEEVEHAELGRIRQVGSPIVLDGQHGQSIRRAPPVLGEHSFEILQEFGYSRSDLDALASAGVIRQHVAKEGR